MRIGRVIARSRGPSGEGDLVIEPFPQLSDDHVMTEPRVIVVMGVAGCGKSTVASLLASRNGGVFHDADDFHPPANIAKMAAGLPLNDGDRAPWLARLRREVVDPAPTGKITVLACSALKKIHRDQLGVGTAGVVLVYLKGSPDVLADRLARRFGHFMKPSMLASQLADLEEPSHEEGVTVEIDAPVEEIVPWIEATLGLRKQGAGA
jgi:gluconokinase